MTTKCTSPLYRLPSQYTTLLPNCDGINHKIVGFHDFDYLKKFAPDHLWQRLPCGHCLSCRLERRRQWAVRCMLEAQSYAHNQFITLTYDDDHVPFDTFYDVDTDDLVTKPTLYKRDFTLFIKRLRYYYPTLRYFACGEYGGTTGRPHFHAILFNVKFEDVDFWSTDFRKIQRTDTGYIAHSDLLSSVWSLGDAVTSEVNFDTCSYVAGYVMKKSIGLSEKNWHTKARNAVDRMTPESRKVLYDLGCIDDDGEVVRPTAEYTVMSRRPGIARDYYDRRRDDIYSADSIILPSPKGAHRLKPSRYFDKLYDIDDPVSMQFIKNRRLVLSKSLFDQRQIIRLTEQDYLNGVALNRFSQTNLRRGL